MGDHPSFIGGGWEYDTVRAQREDKTHDSGASHPNKNEDSTKLKKNVELSALSS